MIGPCCGVIDGFVLFTKRQGAKAQREVIRRMLCGPDSAFISVGAVKQDSPGAKNLMGL
ncbi:hypothetical protein [Caldilinea sp.]|uniref:hypothetical protein n=1 Tax=Caldilinea sp. TaxID=2293560 RepID=UPI002607411C|nr:hypothetical protein [Caldilinea sp.]